MAKLDGPKHLSAIKELSPKAYKAYIQLLIEDCTDKFFCNPDGTDLHAVVKSPLGDVQMVLAYDPASTSMSGPWVMVDIQEFKKSQRARRKKKK